MNSSNATTKQPGPEAGLTLIVKRSFKASAERVFDAWIEPEQLKQWWGPQGVVCPEAQVDLRVGGAYRIANRIPDGSTVWIFGEFLRIERSSLLVYSWHFEPGSTESSRVTVRFVQLGESTEVTLTHDRIPDAATRDEHEKGWFGCLDGLAQHLGA